MRIGIDARFLTHPQAGGFKTYTVNLLTALAQIDRENEYFVYVDRPPIDHASLSHDANFVYRIVPGTPRLIGMPLREQVRLRWRIWQDKLDLVHFFCNTAPVGLSNHYVVTLHDTIQVTAKRVWGSHLADFKLLGMTEYSRQSILHTVSCADRVITVSNFEREEIGKTLHIPLERIVVTHLAPNAVYRPYTDEEKDASRRELARRFGVSGKYMLGVGYEPRKNVALLIRAFAELVHELPHLNLVVVVAEEHQRRLYSEQVANLELGSRVALIGALPPEDLATLYNLAETFVFPSVRESFGLPPIEAMACGTPTIAMNMSSIPEIVQDGALLVDGIEAEVWANAMREVVGSEGLRADLRKRGLHRAAQLSWRRCAEETLEAYCSIVARAPMAYGQTLTT